MTGRPAVPKKKRATRDGVPLIDFSEKLLAIPGSTHDLIKRYLDHITVQHYSAQTIRRYRSDLLQWAAFCEERGLTQCSAITRQHLERFQASLFRYRKANGDALSLRTQKMRLVVVRNFFSWAVKKHFLPANPAADLDLPRPAQVLPVSLTPDEVRRVLAAPDPDDLTGLRNWALLETLYSTGIRRSEVTRLEVDDIEASTGLLRIRQGKGRKDRVIPIGARALDWLDRYQLATRTAWLHDPTVRYLFLQPDGYGMTPSQVAEMVRRCLRAAEVTKRGCCHLFRHTFATQLLNAGCDLRYIKDMLGHANMDTTAHYAQVAVDRLKTMHEAFHPSEAGLTDSAGVRIKKDTLD